MADLVKTPILGQSFGDIRKMYALTQRGAWSAKRLSSIVSALRKTVEFKFTRSSLQSRLPRLSMKSDTADKSEPEEVAEFF